MSTDKNVRVYVLNGPNLNLLGIRKPEIYGTGTLADIETMLEQDAERLGATLTFHQSNHEGQLIDWVQEARTKADGIIINAGGYTHTSIALRDAIEAVELPTIEVHISDIHAREEYRKKSYISEVAIKMICGQGAKGYSLALEQLIDHCRAAVE